MSQFVEYYTADMMRYGEGGIERWTKKFHYYFRKASLCQNALLRKYYAFRYYRVCEKHGIEIPKNVSIGKGLYMAHPYNITINKEAVLGENVNIHKGVTIGQENRGARKGAPTIGNQVWIGINATVVGKIVIGEDVMIAPGAYVNHDVPAHSIAIGNPCKVIAREHATEGYINRLTV